MKHQSRTTLFIFFIHSMLCNLPASAQIEQIDLKSLARKASPAVMLLTTFKANGEEIASGTGFLISSDGKLMTNLHVIEDGAKAQAKAANGGLYSVEGVLASDPENDLAVLKIASKGLPFLTLENSDNIAVGSRIAIIGSPLGLEGSMSEGIVAAFREFDEGIRYIQITAPISPGSSGSPVLDAKGRVIAIATAIIRGGQALNLAVPANVALALIARAEEAKTVKPIGTVGTRDDTKIINDPDFMAANLAESVKDFTQQLKYAQDLVRRYPNNSKAHTILGSAYMHLGSYEAAVESCRQAIKLYPENLVAWLIIAQVYERASQLENAEAAYVAVAEVNPAEAKTYYRQIYRIYDAAGKNERAIAPAKKVIELEPLNEDNYYYLGLTYFKLSRHDEAVAAFKQALAIKQDFAHAWFQIGSCYVKQNKYLDGASAYKKYAALVPDDPEGWLSVGVAYMQADWYTDALEPLKKCVALKPSNDIALYNLAVVYVNLKDKQNAKKIYNTLRGLNPLLAERLKKSIR